MPRLQIDVTDAQVEELERVMKECGISTKKELINNALTLLEWAIRERKRGRIIAAIDEGAERSMNCTCPFWIESVNLRNPLPRIKEARRHNPLMVLKSFRGDDEESRKAHPHQSSSLRQAVAARGRHHDHVRMWLRGRNTCHSQNYNNKISRSHGLEVTDRIWLRFTLSIIVYYSVDIYAKSNVLSVYGFQNWFGIGGCGNCGTNSGFHKGDNSRLR